MERFPFLEILFKKISKNFFLRDKIKSFLFAGSEKKYSKRSDKEKDNFFTYLKKIGIVKGDIVILHSSMDELSRVDISAIEIINYLLEILGPEGTLVIPTFPLYNDKNTVGDCYIYSSKKTTCWTGLLPNIFLRYPDVIRSEFPYNSLAAKGKHAQLMMENNLLDNKIYGENSAWVYCIRNSAKVLFLGTPAFHTNTISHIPEDLLGDKWPINNFFIRKSFVLQGDSSSINFEANIRADFWANNLKSYYRTYLLRKNKLLQEEKCSGIYVGYIENSYKVVDYLSNLALQNKTMYYVPRKYKKKTL